jgi:hypothetical protein
MSSEHVTAMSCQVAERQVSGAAKSGAGTSGRCSPNLLGQSSLVLGTCLQFSVWAPTMRRSTDNGPEYRQRT